jgi:hypothetical protein
MMSVYGLVTESLAILMQRQPKELDHLLPDCYQKVFYRVVAPWLLIFINTRI